jgi:hypothetical protein
MIRESGRGISTAAHVTMTIAASQAARKGVRVIGSIG